MELVVAVMEDDVVRLGMSAFSVENLGRREALGLEIRADELGGDDPGRGEVDPGGFPAVTAAFTGIFPLVVAGAQGWRGVGHGKTLPESILRMVKRRGNTEKSPIQSRIGK